MDHNTTQHNEPSSDTAENTTPDTNTGGGITPEEILSGVTTVAYPSGEALPAEEAAIADNAATRRPLFRDDPEYYDFTHEEPEFDTVFFCVTLEDETQELVEEFPEATALKVGMKPDDLKTANIPFPDIKTLRKYKNLEVELFDAVANESVGYCKVSGVKQETSDEQLKNLPREVKTRLFQTIYAKSAFNISDEAWLRVRHELANQGAILPTQVGGAS